MSDETESKPDRVVKDDAQWRAELTPDQYQVTRRAGTERAFTGKFWNTKTPGTYRCVCCGAELFSSGDKYDSGSGWPSFIRPAVPAHVAEHSDVTHGMVRVEVKCSRCDAHLGHVFEDGPHPTGLRYCINSAALSSTKLMVSEVRPLVVRGGRVHDGLGSAALARDVLVRGGVVEALLQPGEPGPSEAEIIGADGCWVTPGFIDLHTHYDAELELAPALGESVRHGVTTIVVGSCGLSMAVGDPVDLADMFCRVEGIPRATVKPLLERCKDWDGPASYFKHLATLPLGPNVASLLGHSAIRAAAMGLGRSLDWNERPTSDELARMQSLLNEALDAGYLGLSVNTLPWDKMDGEAFRSRPTPSVFASWSEYRALAKLLRERGAILQGVPNVSTKLNVFLFAALSAGLGRRPLKTMLIAMMDTIATRGVHRLVGVLTRLTNRILGGDLRMQALPNTFDMWVDGIEVPLFEEFGAGTEALHIEDPEGRAKLLRDPDYRRRFKKHWGNRLRGRAYHRDLSEIRIVACPDTELVGKSFAELAKDDQDPIDVLLDLVAEHGRALRWYTVVANDRLADLEWIVDHPDILIGFSDAGAHLRNMAYYNFPLRMLKLVRDAEQQGRGFMTIERAVQRLTAEIADWLGLDIGRIVEGARADLVVIDPSGLDARLEALHEEPMREFADLPRLVRRNDEAVRCVVIRGRVAHADGVLASDLGRERGFGEVLAARHPASHTSR